MKKYHSWCTKSDKQGVLVLVKKCCSVTYDTIVELDNSTAIMDLIMPDGIVINTLAEEDDVK